MGMTIKVETLVKKLQEMPQDAFVIIQDTEDSGGSGIEEVRLIEGVERHRQSAMADQNDEEIPLVLTTDGKGKVVSKETYNLVSLIRKRKF